MASGDVLLLSIWDYVVFGLTLLISLGIGLYYAFKGNQSTSDYLLASRSLSPVPVAFSLTATFLSSLSILGYVGEVYAHGLQLIWMLVGCCLGMLLAMNTSLPLLYRLKITSVNEYISLRYKSVALRKTISAMNVINSIAYLGICLYAPTLALDAITPLSLYVYIPVLGAIVTLYSSMGGLKAVIWTDTFQTVVIIAGVLMATGFAIATVGGVGNMLEIAAAHGRTQALDFSFGLYTRHTVINTMTMGVTSFIMTYGVGQSTLQRVSTLPNMKTVRIVLLVNLVGLVILLGLLYVCGLAVFAVYADCDPLTLNLVQSKDQLLPYFVLDYLGQFTGLPGLFVACMFSATLSSISSALNSTVAMIWVDFLSEITYFKNLPESGKALTNKITTLVVGALIIAIAFLATVMGGVMQAGYTVQGALSGPVTGTFLLGMILPYTNHRGAFLGTFVAFCFMLSLSVGSMFLGTKPVVLPLSIDNCTNTYDSIDLYNITAAPVLPEVVSPPHPLFGISYTFYGAIGILACITVGAIVTLFTRNKTLANSDPALIFKCWRKRINKQQGNKISDTKELEVISRFDEIGEVNSNCN